MPRISKGETVYYIHEGCPKGGLSIIENPGEYIAAPYFSEGKLIPDTIECTACGDIMTQLESERADKLREEARIRNELRREELGY